LQRFGVDTVRILFAAIAISLVSSLVSPAPSRAADLDGGSYGGGSYGAVHAWPTVEYDFEPGVEFRAYWLRPWAGRHYFPAGGAAPVVGRKEVLGPTPVSNGKQNFHRQWSSAPIDTIEQPPLVYAPSYSGGERISQPAPTSLPLK
jgi:hypothetical protein